MRTAAIAKWSVGTLLLATVLGATFAAPWLAGRLVTSSAVHRAQERGFELRVGRARVGWRYVELEQVHVSLEGVPTLGLEIERVQVEWSLWHTKRAAVLLRPHVTVASDFDELTAQLQAFRGRHAHAQPAANSEESAAKAWRLAFEDGALDCKPERVLVAGARGQLEAGQWQVNAAEVQGQRGPLALVARELRADGSASTVGHVQIGKLELLTSPAEPHPEATPPSKSDLTAVLPTGASPEEAKSDVLATSFLATDRQLDAAFGRLLALREHLALERWKGPTSLDVDSLTFAIPPALLGPWGFHIHFGPDAVSIQLEPTLAPAGDPGAAETRRPLELHAIVPRSRGRLRAEARVGPASLAELGLRSGWFGLLDVDHAALETRGSVELDPDERSLAADGVLAIHQLSIQHKGLADAPVSGLSFAVRGTLTASPGLKEWSLVNGAIELGAVRTDVKANWVRTTDGLRLSADWALPETSCEDILSAVPAAMRPRLGALTMEGTLAARGSVRLDTSRLQDSDVQLSLAQRCRVSHVPNDLTVQRLRGPFDLRTYGPHGEPKVSRFGPGTDSWTPLDRISPYVTVALLTCEDAAFFSHEGFSALALRNALAANIRAGRFAQGGSTVTMQLAKNLFLDRRKQLGRKIEEAVLTIWLEQALSKDDILELYLNVVEFGPNLYGIGRAAQHYFGRSAAELDPLESMFLISILPAPVKRHAMRSLGQPTEHYLDYLRRQLKLAFERGRLEETEYTAAAGLPLKFQRDGEPPPPPRPLPPRRTEAGDDPHLDPHLNPHL